MPSLKPPRSDPPVGEGGPRLDAADYHRMKRDVVATYNRAAHLYDQVGTRRFGYFGRHLVDRLDVGPAATALDVAVGRGAILFPLAERVGPSGLVVGFDLAPDMAAQTRSEVRRRGLAHVRILQMDADVLAFAPARFDVVTCGFALFFVDFERTLPSLHGLLKPEGSFAASVTHSPADAEEFERWKWLYALRREVLRPDFRPPPAWLAPLRLGRPELLAGALERAGFVDIRIETIEASFHFADEEDWWQFELSQVSRFWVEGMSRSGRTRYRREAFARLREMREPAGIRVLDGALLAFARRH